MGPPPASTPVQRLAVPHTFNENLGFSGAALAVTQAFLRIFLGSLVFAVWGTTALWLWDAIENRFLRGLVLLPVLALFLASMLALMIGISVAVKAVVSKRQ